MSNSVAVLNINDIIKILPHRYPFLLVDRIIELDLKQDRIVGLKSVTFNEHFFQGHFPDAPIMPGVLILEALAQTGGVLIHQKGYHEKIAVLMSISSARFRSPVRPGDTLTLECLGLHFTARGGKIKGTARVQERVAVEVEITFGMMGKEQMQSL